MKITKGDKLTQGKVYMAFQIDHAGWVFDSIESVHKTHKIKAGEEFLCLESSVFAIEGIDQSYYDVKVFGVTAEFFGWARIQVNDDFVEVTEDGPAIAELH